MVLSENYAQGVTVKKKWTIITLVLHPQDRGIHYDVKPNRHPAEISS